MVSKGRWLGLSLMALTLALGQAANAEVSKPAGQKPVAAKPGTATNTTAKKKPGPPPDKATSAKVNAYIELMNAESNDLFAMRQALLHEIDPKLGPTCKEYIHLQQPLGPDGGKYDAYRKGLKAKPALKPDAAALKMVDAVQELWNLGKEPGPHGPPERGPNDEWCKRLKAVFPRYMASFDKYIEGSHEVGAYVDAFTDDRDVREVDAMLKKYGKHYHYQFAALTLEGKLMMRAVRAEIAKNEPDAAVLKQHFDAYLALADETKAMMDKEPNKAAEPYPVSFQFFLSESMPKLKRASDGMLATLADKPDKKRAERLDRNWGELVSAYNEIIGYGNQMSWSPKQK